MEIENKRKNVSRKNSDGTKLIFNILSPINTGPKKIEGFLSKNCGH